MHWLAQRQSLLIIFNELCQTHANTELEAQPFLIQTFCQKLMDYVSMGHFKIFEKLADAQANCNPGLGELNPSLVSQILQNTLASLEFNDRYEQPDQYQPQKFSEDLSKLGQELAHRMDCEDQLIKGYLEMTNSLAKLSAAS